MTAVRTRTRFLATVLVGAVTALGTLAFAQPRGGKASGKGKPPAAKADAGASAQPMTPDEGQSSDGGAKTGNASGAPPEPPPPADVGDGGVKPSPLNPAAQEMPASSSVDAGVPLDYDRLLADIAALRARVAAVSDNLYQSRIAIAVQTDGDHLRVARLAVSLDDGIVYTAPPTFNASDMTVVYDHAVAPGRHAVTLDVDRKDDRDEAFRTSQRNRFTVDVPRDNKVAVQVKILDDSSMGGDFPSDKSGKYDLRFKVKAVAKPVGK
jgi:hypothetical protein